MGICEARTVRYLATGDVDPTYASPLQSRCLSTMAATDRGELYLPFAYQSRIDGAQSSLIVRVGERGSPIVDLGLVSADRFGTLPWSYGKVALTANLQPVAVARMPEPALAAVRLLGGGPDLGFGVQGIARLPTPPRAGRARIVRDPPHACCSVPTRTPSRRMRRASSMRLRHVRAAWRISPASWVAASSVVSRVTVRKSSKRSLTPIVRPA